jgi:hypothetical protein
VRRFYANFSYQAGSWMQPRRVIAKVEWHPGELYPRVDPLLACSALVIEGNDILAGSRHVGDDEPDAR